MVTVIIVNWNSGRFLQECLRSLSRQALQPDQVLVVDNGSTDDSSKWVGQAPGYKVVMLGDNLGFAAANNLAIRECRTEYVALLNPDAFPEPDWLENLLVAARANPEVAAFGSRQMMHGVANTLDGMGDIYHFTGLVWRDGHGCPAASDTDSVVSEIFSPCAGAALYRRDALLAVGGFDEDYFCYVEDVDLGFRLRLAGYRSMYVPGSVVQHVGSASTGGQRSDFAAYHGHRNLVWTFVKNMPGLLFWLLLPAHLLLNLVSVGLLFCRGQGRVVLRAKKDALKGIPGMWRKRRQIQAKRTASVRDIWRVLDKRIIR